MFLLVLLIVVFVCSYPPLLLRPVFSLLLQLILQLFNISVQLSFCVSQLSGFDLEEQENKICEEMRVQHFLISLTVFFFHLPYLQMFCLLSLGQDSTVPQGVLQLIVLQMKQNENYRSGNGKEMNLNKHGHHT